VNDGIFFPSDTGAIFFRISSGISQDANQAIAAANRFKKLVIRELAEDGLVASDDIRLLWNNFLATNTDESLHFVDLAINPTRLGPATLERILAHYF
jgi:hypothetical protein